MTKITTPLSQFQKLIDAEQYVTWATNDVMKWTSDERTRAALKRAQYLLGEMRQAAYFLTDPECTEHLKEEATKRLVQVIINCE